MRPGHVLVLLALMVPASAAAAARARDGGTLRLAVLPEVRADRWGDTPEGAVLRSLVAAPLCRVEAGGRVQPVLATTQRSADAVSVAPRAGARFPSGAPLGSAELGRAWAHALERSPVARAALAPVRDVAAALEQRRGGRGGALALPLAYPWPDLELTLCHPALAPVAGEAPSEGIGPYATDGGFRGPGAAVVSRGTAPPRRVRAHCAVAPGRPACAGDEGRAGAAR